MSTLPEQARLAVEQADLSGMFTDPNRLNAFLHAPVQSLAAMGIDYGQLEQDAKRDAGPMPFDEGMKRGIAAAATAKAEARWWGIEFALNHEACQLVQTGQAGIAGVATIVAGAANAVPPPAGQALATIATVLAGAFALHATAIYAADKGSGVYFVWPWPLLAVVYAPALTPIALLVLAVPYTN